MGARTREKRIFGSVERICAVSRLHKLNAAPSVGFSIRTVGRRPIRGA